MPLPLREIGHRTWFGEAIGDEARNVSVFESLFQKFLFIHSCYVFSKNFYYNEKNGYLLPESGAFLSILVAY